MNSDELFQRINEVLDCRDHPSTDPQLQSEADAEPKVRAWLSIAELLASGPLSTPPTPPENLADRVLVTLADSRQPVQLEPLEPAAQRVSRSPLVRHSADDSWPRDDSGISTKDPKTSASAPVRPAGDPCQVESHVPARHRWALWCTLAVAAASLMMLGFFWSSDSIPWGRLRVAHFWPQSPEPEQALDAPEESQVPQLPSPDSRGSSTEHGSQQEDSQTLEEVAKVIRLNSLALAVETRDQVADLAFLLPQVPSWLPRDAATAQGAGQNPEGEGPLHQDASAADGSPGRSPSWVPDLSPQGIQRLQPLADPALQAWDYLWQRLPPGQQQRTS